MTRLYILEQKIKTLEIIVETLVEELIDEELIDQDKFDKKLIERINELSKEVKDLSRRR